ncbi:MAG: HmuY family protein, partial [Bacteroidota bacterium]
MKTTLDARPFQRLIHVLLALCLIISVTSCGDDDEPFDDVDPTPTVLEVQSAADVVADTGNTGQYTFYSLRENRVIDRADSATDNWDLAFKGTRVLTNGGTSGPGAGGAQVMNGIFDEFGTAPADGYATDGNNGLAIPTGSGNGWYTYTATSSPQHAILPIAGKVIMVRTGNGHYAKIEMLSYYEGKPNTT